MPRSIIDIEVKDEAFKKFLELFKTYQDNTAKMKGVWDATGASVAEASEAITDASEAAADTANSAAAAAISAGDLAEAFAAGSLASAAIFDTLSRTEDVANRTSTTFGTIAGHSKTIAGAIIGATGSLIKWGTLTAGMGLLGMGGGLLGMDSLASFASGQRRSSQGLGVSAGEMTSFGTNLGRLVDPSMLAGVQNAQADTSQWGKFAQLGISPSAYMNQDPAQLSVAIIQRAKQLWQNAGPLGHTMQAMRMSGLDQFMSFQDWTRIGSTSQQEISRDIAKYQAGVGPMGASDKTLQAWQDFQVQLSTAGQEIKTTLIDGLVKLTGPLGDLSKSIETALSGLLSSPNLKIWIEDVATGIQSLAKYLGSPEFIANMGTFATDIGYAAQKLGTVLQWMGLIPATPGNASSAGLPQVSQVGMGLGRFGGGSKWNFADVANKYGLTNAEMYAQMMQESGGNPNLTSKKGAQGLFQLMPATQTQFGVTNPNDPSQSANAAGMYMQQLLQKYNGNYAEALAAYNWGPGNLDKDIAANGQNWLTKAPRETQGYVSQIAQRMGVTVTVINQTGAQTAILANGMLQ